MDANALRPVWEAVRDLLEPTTAETLLVDPAHDARLIFIDSRDRVLPTGAIALAFQPIAKTAERQLDFPGVGLGLALVKALSAALGAHVELTSRPGSGSTFAIVFPPPPEVVDG